MNKRHGVWRKVTFTQPYLRRLGKAEVLSREQTLECGHVLMLSGHAAREAHLIQKRACKKCMVESPKS